MKHSDNHSAMPIRLIQKAFLKGTREFEIVDDAVYVRTKGLIKEEKLTVALAMLNPEPIVHGSELEFHDRANRRPLLSLLLNNPNAEEFNAFVDTLKLSIMGEDDPITDIETVSPDSSRPPAPGWNVYDEPPEFDEPDEARAKTGFVPVNPQRLDADITMLKTYLKEDDIGPLLDALEALKAEPNSEAAFNNMVNVYNGLGILQGAVLTYASYLKVLLSHSIWSE